MRAEKRALGISIHTGGACVVVGGSPRDPEIVANEVIHILDNSERFCYHMAAEMPLVEADQWIARTRGVDGAGSTQHVLIDDKCPLI